MLRERASRALRILGPGSCHNRDRGRICGLIAESKSPSQAQAAEETRTPRRPLPVRASVPACAPSAGECTRTSAHFGAADAPAHFGCLNRRFLCDAHKLTRITVPANAVPSTAQTHLRDWPVAWSNAAIDFPASRSRRAAQEWSSVVASHSERPCRRLRERIRRWAGHPACNAAPSEVAAHGKFTT